MTLVREVVLTIPGTAAPKGSLKCVGRNGRHQLIEDNPRAKTWRQTIVRGIRGRVTAVPEQYQPVGIEFTVTVERPSSNKRDRHPVTRSSHDVDKLARLILDALQDAEILHDDAQVVELIARKAFVDDPDTPDTLGHAGVRVRIYPYGTS